MEEKPREVRSRGQIYDYRFHGVLRPFPLTLQRVSQKARLTLKWCFCLVFHSLFPLITWNSVLYEGHRLLQVADWSSMIRVPERMNWKHWLDPSSTLFSGLPGFIPAASSRSGPRPCTGKEPKPRLPPLSGWQMAEEEMPGRL